MDDRGLSSISVDNVEYAAKDLDATKAFFSAVFGWEFTDYGPEYTAFANQGLDRGFYQSDACSRTANGAALLVFYSEHLEATYNKVVDHGGEVIKPIFKFPGGFRFHFIEPSGNEFAVWSERRA